LAILSGLALVAEKVSFPQWSKRIRYQVVAYGPKNFSPALPGWADVLAGGHPGL
jgi:hypothetical protein